MCRAGWLIIGSSVGDWQEQGRVTGSEQGPAGEMNELGEDEAGNSCIQHSTKAPLAGK